MRDSTEEKSLIESNENSIFHKIKSFLRNLFHKNKTNENSNVIGIVKENSIENNNDQNTFLESIKYIEDDEAKLIKLQKKYRSGEIKEEDMTEEQINSLCTLYDKQIDKLRKSNELRKQKLLEYRRKFQTE